MSAGLFASPGNAGKVEPTIRVPAPVSEPDPNRPSVECMPAWAEYERQVELAARAAEQATKAAQALAVVQGEAQAAVKAAQDAKEAHEALVKEAAQVAADLTRLEKSPKQVNEQLQQETSHAAYVSFKRGEISADELREVFRRAEGWTPEHERLTKRTTELRAEEAAAAKARIAAERAVKPAQAKASVSVPPAAAAAQAAQTEARTAQTAAEVSRAAAENCERARRR